MHSLTWKAFLGRLGMLCLSVLLVSGSAACRGGGADEGAEGDEKTSESAEKESKKEDGEEGDEGDEGDEEEEEEAVPVALATLGRGRIESVLRFSTNLEAEQQVQVLADSPRKVTALLVEEGDRVRRGAVLIRLEDDEQRTELERIESQLTKSRRELKRNESLFEQELISEQDFNDARYDVEQLELALADAQRELSYTEVRAPIGGTITQRLVKVGDNINVNQHLFDIIDFASIVARVYVPEKELARLEVGQAARVTAQALGREERFGTIERIAPVVDSRSGTVKVTVALPEEEGLRPGMYVSVELVTQVHDDAVLVPKRALVYDDDQLFVFRMAEGDRVERLLVQPVLEDRQHIEPDGVLAEGDRVVVAGQAGLKNGSLVRDVENAPREADEASEVSQGERVSS
jgi:membrane fusion protein (multidrug efflux system)